MKKTIGSLVNRSYNNYIWHRHHQRHKLLARSALRNIELYKGKTDPSFIMLSNEYSNDVLGWRGYAPWLYVYSAVAGKFKEGWIPDNYYGSVVYPAIKGKYGQTSLLKSFTNQLFRNGAFPDIAYCVNGLFMSRNYKIISVKDIKNFLFKNSNKIVYKIDSSFRGRGIYFFEKDSFDIEKVRALGNGVFQDYIEQHDIFNKLISTSVVNIRLTTVLEDSGEASLRACILRVSRSTDTHVKSESNIKIPIDKNTGELEAVGYLPGWQIVDRHPDTKVEFADTIIPCFNKCVSIVLQLQKLIPQVRCIGWDVTVDKNNEVKIMEWNGGFNGFMYSEAISGPCFADLGWENLWR